MQILNFIIILLTFSFISCKNDLKVAIVEPLPKDVIQKYSETDSLFLSTYNNVRLLVDSVYNTKRSNLEYSHLTYLSFYDLAKKLKDEKEELSRDSSLIQDWKNKHENDLVKFNRDSSRYRKYIEDNHYSNYLDLELLQIYEKEILVKYNFVEILIKPKNGHGIRRVAGSVKIMPKKAEEEIETFNIEYANAYFSYQGFTKKNVKESGTETNRLSKNSLSSFLNVPVNIIKQKYNIAFDVHELVIDDRYIDVALDSVPFAMRYFFKSSDEFNKTYYINEHINKDYTSLNKFINDLATAKLKNEYKNELDFYNKGFETYFAN